MRLANINGRAHAAFRDRFVDLAAASAHALPADPMAYVNAVQRAKAGAFLDSRDDHPGVVPALPEFGPPIPRPGKILAVALNYREHAAESQKAVPDEPAVFSKLTSSLCGPYDAIEVPVDCEMVDYEAEVVVVVGTRMRGIHPVEAWSCIAGITAGQDISDRHEQRRAPLAQFSLAKSYDTFSPTGPVMTTLDEFDDRDDIAVSGSVSGTVVQRGTTAQLIYSIPELVAWTCRYVTLEPGDLIFTGTPDGVGARRRPPIYLAEGMTLETTVSRVGTMHNRVVAVGGVVASEKAVDAR
jgi:2,4-diketo-3-deoxy-L-fuconate hydrolase